jgi:hypothetical protein
VVLVDRVDTSDDLTIAGTLRVPSTIEDDRNIEPVLRSSPQIIEFLRCDVRPEEPSRDAAVQRICASILEELVKRQNRRLWVATVRRSASARFRQ